MSEYGERDDTYTSSTGLTIKVRPVSPFLLERVRAGVKLPEPPTYTIHTAAGTDEVHPHDAESAAAGTPEEQAAWDDYQKRLRAAQAEVNERITRLILLRGVETDVPEYGWDTEQEALGIAVPKDPNDRKVHYILTEVVGRADDLTEIMAKVMESVGVSAEDVNAARDSFRHSVRQHTVAPTNGAVTSTVDA